MVKPKKLHYFWESIYGITYQVDKDGPTVISWHNTAQLLDRLIDQGYLTMREMLQEVHAIEKKGKARQ